MAYARISQQQKRQSVSFLQVQPQILMNHILQLLENGPLHLLWHWPVLSNDELTQSGRCVVECTRKSFEKVDKTTWSWMILLSVVWHVHWMYRKVWPRHLVYLLIRLRILMRLLREHYTGKYFVVVTIKYSFVGCYAISLGLETEGELMTKLIEANTGIQHQKKQVIYNSCR